MQFRNKTSNYDQEITGSQITDQSIALLVYVHVVLDSNRLSSGCVSKV